jgi:hypothetical protein
LFFRDRSTVRTQRSKKAKTGNLTSIKGRGVASDASHFSGRHGPILHISHWIGGSYLAALPALPTRNRNFTQKPAHRVPPLIEFESFGVAVETSNRAHILGNLGHHAGRDLKELQGDVRRPTATVRHAQCCAAAAARAREQTTSCAAAALADVDAHPPERPTTPPVAGLAVKQERRSPQRLQLSLCAHSESARDARGAV